MAMGERKSGKRKEEGSERGKKSAKRNEENGEIQEKS
jgi:hypothetical protein